MHARSLERSFIQILTSAPSMLHIASSSLSDLKSCFIDAPFITVRLLFNIAKVESHSNYQI